MKLPVIPGHEPFDKSKNLSKRETGALALSVLSSVGKVRKEASPDRARQEAKKRSEAIFAKLAAAGIPVTLEGIDLSERDDVPLIVGNHQLFGLEAMAAYSMIPNHTRIMLKKELTEGDQEWRKGRALKFPQGIRALDPIIFDRKKSPLEAMREIGRAQIETIAQEQAVLVYPEGFRSENGQLRRMNAGLYKGAWTAIKELPKAKQNIGIITADTHPALPFRPEDAFSNKAQKTFIHFSRCIVECSQRQKATHEEVIRVLQKNLDEFAEARLENQI